jgi:hypothetical protein
MTPTDTFITDIIFRCDTTKEWKGTIFAVMPHEAERNGSVTTYQHQGQHSCGNYNHMIATSRPANEFESADLKAELKSIGYNIKEVKKRNYNKYLRSYYAARA